MRWEEEEYKKRLANDIQRVVGAGEEREIERGDPCWSP